MCIIPFTNHHLRIIIMENIVNEPAIEGFLKKIPRERQLATLKDLILIGINVVSGGLRGNERVNNAEIAEEFEKVKVKIDYLA